MNSSGLPSACKGDLVINYRDHAIECDNIHRYRPNIERKSPESRIFKIGEWEALLDHCLSCRNYGNECQFATREVLYKVIKPDYGTVIK